ncbi:MAG: transglycosylase SLT domain-containing protein [Alcanivoracaceae bacterium]
MKVLLLALVMLSGCASVPSDINDACVIFDENGGWINNWHKQSKKVEREFGVPVPVMLATIWKESGFNHKAKPPRTRLLGFIPWKRPSDAYGYPQALKSTWRWYKEETGRSGADRDDFYDAMHFVGWYHTQSNRRNNIPLNDAYHLYLAYYSGHGGYQRGTWKSNAWLKKAAGRVSSQAERYRAQLARCGRL